MEERTEVGSQRMEISLGLLFLGHFIALAYGHPSLKTPESVIGIWKGDVKIQCIYDPLRGYSQVLVKWLVQRGSDPVTIFLRDSTGDHIQQAKYRGRLKVSHNVPGDVSLQLNNLQMDDRSHYTCEVTWQTPDGNKVMRYKSIELRVQKYSSNPPIINTEALTTMHFSLEATTTMTFSTMNSASDLTTNGKLEETTSGPATTTMTLSTMNSASDLTTNGKLEETTSGPDSSNALTTLKSSLEGRKLPFFAIILIISLCCIVVFTIAYIMFCHRTVQQEHIYEVRRVCGSSEETKMVTTIGSDELDSQALINDYSDEPCLGQEYQIINRSTMTVSPC